MSIANKLEMPAKKSYFKIVARPIQVGFNNLASCGIPGKKKHVVHSNHQESEITPLFQLRVNYLLSNYGVPFKPPTKKYLEVVT